MEFSEQVLYKYKQHNSTIINVTIMINNNHSRLADFFEDNLCKPAPDKYSVGWLGA